MSPLEAARRRTGMNTLVVILTRESGRQDWHCAGCGADIPFESDDEIPHREGCLQVALPSIVAALEAAERVVKDFDKFDTPEDDGCCWFCHERFTVDGNMHTSDCPWLTLVAALKA